MKVNKIFAEEWTTEADKNEPEKKKRNEQTPTLAMNRRSALWIFFRFFSNRFLNSTAKTCFYLHIYTGAPNVNFRKSSVRKTIWELEFSEHLL